jgi:hypothetical protein
MTRQEKIWISELMKEIKPLLKSGDRFYHNKKWYTITSLDIDTNKGGLQYNVTYVYKNYRKEEIKKGTCFNVRIIDNLINIGDVKITKI